MAEKLSRQLKWYYENKERARKNRDKWRAGNPDKVAEANRKYREEFKKKHGMPPSRYYKLKRSGGLAQK